MIEYKMYNGNQFMPTTAKECSEIECMNCIFWCYGDMDQGCDLHDSLHDAGVNEID